jgi:hAT family C-terminal dimerisation region
LQASSFLTIHLVLPFYRQLRASLTTRVHHSDMMISTSRSDRLASALAARALRAMSSTLVVHSHVAALLLHPLCRTLESLYQDEQEREKARSEGLELLKAAIAETKPARFAEASQTANSSSFKDDNRSAHARYNPGAQDDMFALEHLFEEPELHPICPIDDKLQRYFKSTISESDRILLQSGDKFALVRFWLRKESVFPCMTEASLRILAIPATQCSSERNFSAAELAQPSKSSRLSPEALESILYLRSKSHQIRDSR